MKVTWGVYLCSLIGSSFGSKLMEHQRQLGNDKDGPAFIAITVSDSVNQGDKVSQFHSTMDFYFTLEDCKMSSLCPNDMKYGIEFQKHLLGLGMSDVVSYLLDKDVQVLKQPINDTAYMFEHSLNRFQGKSTGKKVRPTKFHYADKYKLLITVPIYVVCALASLGVYYCKRQLLVKTNFKFSNISRILFKYLSIKVIFGIIYLIYLVLFDDFGMNKLGNFKIFILLTILKYILNVTTFLLVCLFAVGYCTSFFTFTNRWLTLWKVCGVTLLYAAQSFPKVFYEIQDINNFSSTFHDSFRTRLPLLVAVCLIILFFVIIGTLMYIAYGTYKYSHNKDARFLLSIQIIVAAYILTPLIVVPHGRSAMPNFVKNKYLLNDRGAQDSYARGVHVPDIIEMLVIGSLIYIWRDLKYVEGDSEGYDKLENNDYELEENF